MPDQLREMLPGGAASIANGSLCRKRLLQVVEQLLQEHRARATYFGPTLFADPAWDILLVLFLAETRQQRLTVSKLCAEIGVPATTGLRWIARLTKGGLVLRRADPTDKRRFFLDLAPAASAAMRSYCWSTAAAERLAA